VGGELRIDGVGRGEELAGAREIADVAVDLAGEHWKAVEPVDLGALDLGVPVGPFDEPRHDPPARAAGEVDEPVDEDDAALAVGLDDEAEAVPSGKRRVEAQRLEDVEREIQPVHLLGVEVEADVVGARERGQVLEARQKLGHDAGALDALEARMQRRQLDRHAGPLVDAALAGGPADGVHGALVLPEIALGVGGRGRGLSQHVVGEGEAARLALTGGVDRLLDRPAGDELLAHEAHGDVDAGADDGLAAAGDQPGQRRAHGLLARRGDELAGEHETPGGGVDEHRRAGADVGAPVAGRELVADERVARGGVGNAQERLGEAHQRYALLARQGILVDKPFDAARARLRPEAGHEAPRQRLDPLRLVGLQRGEREKRRYAVRLGPPVGVGDRGAQRSLRDRLGAESGKGIGHDGVAPALEGFAPDRTPVRA